MVRVMIHFSGQLGLVIAVSSSAAVSCSISQRWPNSMINDLPRGDIQQSAASEQPPGCQWAALSQSISDS